MPEVEIELGRRLAAGEELVQATVIRLDGAPPSRPGAKALFGTGGALAGTLGCSEFDSAAARDAARILAGGTPELRSYRHDLGSVEVYLEPHLARPVLAVLGQTPVGETLSRWAADVGFRVVREVPEEAGGQLFAVFTDHDAAGLVEDLGRVLALEPRFVGLMGSRRHTGHHLEALRGRGVADSVLARVQSPVGLDLGAESAEEIALSILAGLVAIRRNGGAGWIGGG